MKKLILPLLALLFISNAFAQLPSSYDLKTLGYVTSVKDQGSCGACWAFATTASLESSYLKHYGISLDISEDNIIDCHNFDESPCNGGSFYMSQALFSIHNGFFTETQDPYTPSVSDCINNYPFPPLPHAYVEEVLFLPSDIQDIKQTLIDYGAVATSMYMNYNDASVWNGTTYKYYDNSISSTDLTYPHCVTIVGWDDSYTFPGAPANGGWIIKDSYGTSWADNGYFYCSYYDAGILTESVVFPTIREIPNSLNSTIVYSHDELGWVDNYGFGTNHSFAMAKYTIVPTLGNVLPQKIMRIGTYAVDSNTSINIKLYKSFNGTSLSGLIDQGDLNNLEYPGFYTLDFNLKADTLQSEIYVVVEYTSDQSCVNPIPIEKLEAGHTSNNFMASTASCWISQNGNTWLQTGVGTSYVFDPCIKMYTETSIIAEMQADVGQQVCVGSLVNLTDLTIPIADSMLWLIDGNPYWNMPSINYTLNNPGITNIYLIVYFGDHIDTVSYPITVIDNPDVSITNFFTSISANLYGASYQWLDCNDHFSIINGEIYQTFTPAINGNYAVEIMHNGCIDTSMCYYVSTSIQENSFKNSINIYPNPTKDYITIDLDEKQSELNIVVRNILGQKLITRHYIDKKTIKLDLPIEKGIYLIEISDGEFKSVFRLIKD